MAVACDANPLRLTSTYHTYVNHRHPLCIKEGCTVRPITFASVLTVASMSLKRQYRSALNLHSSNIQQGASSLVAKIGGIKSGHGIKLTRYKIKDRLFMKH